MGGRLRGILSLEQPVSVLNLFLSEGPEALPLACEVGAGICAGNFLVGFEGWRPLAGLHEEGPGRIDQLRGELGPVCGHEGEDRLLDGSAHRGEGNRFDALLGLFGSARPESLKTRVSCEELSPHSTHGRLVSKEVDRYCASNRACRSWILNPSRFRGFGVDEPFFGESRVGEASEMWRLPLH
jgi:hypothetical protein